MIKEKLEKELLKQSPVLKLEIKEIKTGQNDIEVTFKNGSTFVACVAGEQSRGIRSTIKYMWSLNQPKSVKAKAYSYANTEVITRPVTP